MVRSIPGLLKHTYTNSGSDAGSIVSESGLVEAGTFLPSRIRTNLSKSGSRTGLKSLLIIYMCISLDKVSRLIAGLLCTIKVGQFLKAFLESGPE